VRLYSSIFLPCLCDHFLGQPFLASYRQKLLAGVTGDILEIGFGTGLNLPHYPAGVRKITTVDPNPGMHRRARQRIASTGIEVDQRLLSSERLPFADNRFDCIVSTWTLCSIDDVTRALVELYRMLKPGGRFLFLEHGLSPEPSVQKWQHRLNWLQMYLGGGCRLDRNIRQFITALPFVTVDIDEFYMEKSPRTHGYMYRGVARK
jgi:ubiquinone/menaquinone biosynthesis C-methylase UbiE